MVIFTAKWRVKTLNDKISVKELNSIIILSVLGFEILLLPKICHSLVSVAAASVMSLILMTVAIFSDIDIYENKLWQIVYFIKNLVVMVLLTKILADAISFAILREMALYKIILIITLLCGYCGYKGIEPIGRISQMLFWFVVLFTLYIYIMSTADVKAENLFADIRGDELSGVIYGFVINSGEIIILLKNKLAGEKTKLFKSVFAAFLLFILISGVIIGKIGSVGANNIMYPFFELMYTADLPDIVIKRQEGIFISLWLISCFITLFVYYFSADMLSKKIFHSGKYMTLIIMAVVFVFSYIHMSPQATMKNYCFFQILGGILTAFVIPLLYVRRNGK